MTHFRSEAISARSILIILVVIINRTHSESTSNHDDLFTINITMTNFTTTQEDQYVFVRYGLPDEELMIIGYLPLVDMSTAHHILTYACATPALTVSFWLNGSACTGEQTIIHAWARNGTSVALPEDVGFSVGRRTPYRYIVINIHYLSTVRSDNSGLQLLMSRKPRKYHAGVMLSGTQRIYLPPKTHTIRTPFSCPYGGPPISIFAVHFHAHQWGRVNSLYRVRGENILQIAKGSPQWPQSFYPLRSPVQIHRGDYIIGQCVYDNDDDRAIYVGSKHTDEMCNVYAMYSYEPAKTSNDNSESDRPPIKVCWVNSVASITSLIPADSVIVPASSHDISEATSNDEVRTEHAIKPSTDDSHTNVKTWPVVPSLPSSLGEQPPALNEKKKKHYILWAICFAVLLSIFVLWGIIRTRSRYRRDCSRTSLNDVKNGLIGSGSIFNKWINEQKGFDRLAQEECNEDNQSSHININDETITMQ